MATRAKKRGARHRQRRRWRRSSPTRSASGSGTGSTSPPTSPNRIATELGEPLGNIAYHVRELEKYGCIELVDTKQRRGATEHYYRALSRTLIDTETWAKLPLEERRPTSRYGLQCIIADAIAADKAGTFDSRTDRHLTYFPVDLDEEGLDKDRRRLRRLPRSGDEDPGRKRQPGGRIAAGSGR